MQLRDLFIFYYFLPQNAEIFKEYMYQTLQSLGAYNHIPNPVESQRIKWDRKLMTKLSS